MLIDCISDLHGYEPKLLGGDVLIICGDLTAHDTKKQYERFILWLSQQPYRCKIVIAGNHDGSIENGEISIGKDPNQNIHYLCDSRLEFEGLKFWGSPYTPTFGAWHFMRSRGDKIKKHWDLIPPDIDVLITHGPPYGILDKTVEGTYVGCQDLKMAVQNRVKPRFHCFGHIHECGGKILKIDETTYINCSYVDERYRPVYSPMRLEM